MVSDAKKLMAHCVKKLMTHSGLFSAIFGLIFVIVLCAFLSVNVNNDENDQLKRENDQLKKEIFEARNIIMKLKSDLATKMTEIQEKDELLSEALTELDESLKEFGIFLQNFRLLVHENDQLKKEIFEVQNTIIKLKFANLR